MFYLVGAFFLFGLACGARYLVLLRLGTFAERARRKAEAYDIGNFIKQCRNKNVQGRPEGRPEEGAPPKAPQIKPKISQHNLPLSPVLFDSALAGANVFRQYMCVDDFMYAAVSRMSGEQIDNISDLSSKIKEYAYNTEGFLNKLKGHVAEEHVAAHLKEAGATVKWPETSNQEGWDLLANGNHIQEKLIKDASSLTEHFKEHPNIPVIVPADAENIPDGAFHFDPSDGIEGLMDFLKEPLEKAVIVDHSLSHADLTENTEQAADFLAGDIDPFPFKIPVVTAAFSSFREFRLLRKKDTDILSALKHIALDATGVGIGIEVGAPAGAAIGTLIFPGPGTAVGTVVGSFVFSSFGRHITNKIKIKPLKEAVEDYKKSFEKFKRKSKQAEKEYENRFQQEKAREQKKLDGLASEIKNAVEEKTSNLRKWTADKERPQESLKADLLNNILIATSKERKKPSWTEWFWPKQKTVNRRIKMKGVRKLLTEQFSKDNFKDRGRLFQKLAEHGLCREYILSEIQKTEEERLRRENDLIKEITQRQKRLLHERSQSIKNLAAKTKEYMREIRKKLSPCIKEIQNRQSAVQKESKKLGKKAA